MLRADSADAAVELWSATWTGPGDDGKADVIRNGLRQVAELAGRVSGHDIVAVTALTPNYLRAYILVRYERLPVFMELRLYNGATGNPSWRITAVNFNTDAAKIFPESIWPRS